DARQGGRRLRDHLEPSRCARQDPGRGPGEVRGDREQGQGRLPGVQADEGENYDGGQAGGMNSPFTPSAAPPDLLSAVIEQAPDAIILADREGAIRLGS